MRKVALAVVIAGVLGGCNGDGAQSVAGIAGNNGRAMSRDAQSEPMQAPARSTGAIAQHPDRGTLFSYVDSKPVRTGAVTRREVQLSEAHAIRAVAEGAMTIQAPDGTPIRLEYARRVEHKDGNWTFIGTPANAKPGEQAVITFGEKAVFGLIPNAGGEPLQITTQHGRTYVAETELSKVVETVSAEADFIAPVIAAAAGTPAGAALKAATAGAVRMPNAAEAQTASNTVDLVLGYTSGMSSRYGGTSGAVTRMNAMVDMANAALAASGVTAQFRLVAAVAVDFPDNTNNRSTLFQLSGLSCTSAPGGQLPDGGVTCTPAARPAALQPLIDARDEFGADLVSLVRTYSQSTNGSCGIGWLIGNGQSPITGADAEFGFTVVSDTEGSLHPDGTATCRSDNLAHELGHNLGLQHDREFAADGDGLDPEEFGATPYAFGYLAAPDAGNFVDVMAPRRPNIPSRLVFSNPQIACGAFPCGVADQADAARALRVTFPLVAAFRANVVPFDVLQRNDYNGEGRSDILWRNSSTGGLALWLAGNSGTTQAMPVIPVSWRVVGSGDFNGDGVSDVLLRNSTDGRNTIWLSGRSTTQQAVTAIAAQAWTVAGVGDFDGDGFADILWRNTTTGNNTIWRSGNSNARIAVVAATTQWRVAGVGDFNGDGRADTVWRNSVTGAGRIWSGGTGASPQVITTVAPQGGWNIVGVNDFDGDGQSDLLWRNSSSGANAIWRSGNSATQKAIAPVASSAWRIASTGDYDGDGVGDILWRNSTTGANIIWRSGNSATTTAVTIVASQSWAVAG